MKDKRPRNCSRLKIKEIRQLRALCYPDYIPDQERHYWDSWQNLNGVCVDSMVVLYQCYPLEFDGFIWLAGVYLCV